MKIGLAMLSLSFVYLTLTSFMYFMKRRLKNTETTIYSKLIITSFIGIILEVLCIFFVPLKQYIYINEVVNRFYLIYILTWDMFFTTYIVSLSKEKKKIKLINIIIYVLYIIFAIVIYILPLKYHSDGEYVYSYGMATNLLYVINAICISVWIISLILHRKEVGYKKYIPLLIFIFGAILNMIIRKINPGILLITVTQTFITIMMYFTIENPDKKLLDELHAAKVISDNANEEKTVFLYNMTNEIRGITKDINVSANEILDETTGKKIDKEIINNYARDIKVSTARFNSITNEILDISSIDSQSIKIYDNKYNVRVLATTLSKTYKEKASSKGLEFRFNVQSDTPESLYGDGIGLKQILGIILDNSVKYTEKGFIELSINNIRKNDICRLIIEIEDSGIGMKSEDINRIFVKNYVNEDNLNLKNNLYNARRLLTLMNGTMVASSNYGKGTIIKVIIDQKVAEYDTELDKYKDAYDDKKMLLVGNKNVKEINKILKNTEIKLDIVNTGRELINKFKEKEKIDLILMEEEAGAFSLIKKLKEMRNFKCNTILLTENKEYLDKFKYRYLDAGFNNCILLPLDENIFIEEVGKYLK